MVLFDTTSLMFHGVGGQTLGRHGKSKDHRPDLRQVIVGVVLDAEGRPICVGDSVETPSWYPPALACVNHKTHAWRSSSASQSAWVELFTTVGVRQNFGLLALLVVDCRYRSHRTTC
jgi:hypothetical protein